MLPLLSEIGEENGIIPMTEEGVPTRKMRAPKRHTPLVDTEVRRSNRVKEIHQGYKSVDCSQKKCSHCNPPTLSSKVIKNLGMQFCNLKAEDLDEHKLNAGGNKAPVARKKVKVQKEKPNMQEGMETSASKPWTSVFMHNFKKVLCNRQMLDSKLSYFAQYLVATVVVMVIARHYDFAMHLSDLVLYHPVWNESEPFEKLESDVLEYSRNQLFVEMECSVQ